MKTIVIFDMDGVLIDSEPEYSIVIKKLFYDLKINLNDNKYSEFVGMSSIKMWTMLKQDFNLEGDVEDLINIEKKIMYEVLDCGKISAPIEGVVSLIRDFQEKNILLSVASSSAKTNINLILEKLGLKEFFQFIISGEEVVYGKPAPDIFLKAAEHFNEDPANCFVIEDSANGILAANSAGMKCVGFRNNGSNLQDLNGADLIVYNFNEKNRNAIIEFMNLDK